jgi:hypothetical protein
LKIYAILYENDLEEELNEWLELSREEIDYIQTNLLTVNSNGKIITTSNLSFENQLIIFKKALRENNINSKGSINRPANYIVISYTKEMKERFASLVEEKEDFDVERLANAIANYYHNCSEYHLKLESIFTKGYAETLYDEFD